MAKAEANAATDSLERGIGHLQQLKAHRARFGALRPDAVSDGLLGLLRHQRLEFGLGPLMLEKRRPGAAEQGGKLRPGVGRAHIDDLDRLDTGPGRLGVEQAKAARRC